MIFSAGGVAESGAGVADYTGELFVLGGIVLTAVLGWISSVILKKLREPVRIETLWARLDAQEAKITDLTTRVESAERRSGAFGRIIRDLARQWPMQHTPRLNPADLDVVDDETLDPDHPWRTRP